LHNLPKRDDWAEVLRSGLVAPPGMSLIAADWSGFEVRLLAELSGDPVLQAACRAGSPHQYLRQRIGAQWSKDQVKRAVFALLYGQGRDGFCAGQPDLPWAQAEQLYNQLLQILAVAHDFMRQQSKSYFAPQGVRTRGGWRRMLPDGRNAGNTQVQGLGADLQRFVLRQLSTLLRRYDAEVVHVVHDEFIVACPPNVQLEVEKLLVDAMETAGPESGLLPDATLPVESKKGRTWADLI
jgi:DNA polymerase-1